MRQCSRIHSERMSDPQGLAFDQMAEDYDVGRPSWPLEMLDGIDAKNVLDLAAGTGKLTDLLVECYADVVAVEPLAGMRSVLARSVPDAKTLEGTAERIPLEDASVDAVFVAEAFHWFDSEAAAQEIERVLRPGGWLVVCFNEWRTSFEPGLSDDARALWNEVASGLPPPGGIKVETGAWRRGLTAFEPLEELAFDHEWVTDAEGVASYYVSVSSFGSVPPTERAQLRAGLIEMLPVGSHRLGLTARVYRGRCLTTIRSWRAAARPVSRR